jgi:hypothetical protein
MYDTPPKRITKSPYLRNVNTGEIFPFHEILAAKNKEWVAHWDAPPVQQPKQGTAEGRPPQYDARPRDAGPPPGAPRNPPNSKLVSPFEHPRNLDAMPDDPAHGDPIGTHDLVEGTEPAIDAISAARKAGKPAPRTRKPMPEADFMDDSL